MWRKEGWTAVRASGNRPLVGSTRGVQIVRQSGWTCASRRSIIRRSSSQGALMRTEILRVPVQLPSVTDFVERFPHYTAARYQERWLFDLIVTPENFYSAAAITDALVLPAVSAVARRVSVTARRHGGLSPFRKQVAGAIVCSLMEANGFSKTGVKRYIPEEGWSRGELYRRVQRNVAAGSARV